jgi:UDP-N-acetylmuramate--alanine ligase
MSGIAEVLVSSGYEVSGSDLVENDVTRRLISLGVKVFRGHDAANSAGAGVVVVSSAAKPSNPEVAAAREAKIPVIPRAEMLAELARMKYSVLVAGAHGKTTTTSLVSTVLLSAGLDPTIVIGGRLANLGTNAKLGTGEYMAAEADESDGSFLKLLPTVAVVTNIDREHLDYYVTLDAVLDAFADFLNKVPFYGMGIVCADCPLVKSILPRVSKPLTTYGFSNDAVYRAADLTLGGGRLSFTALKDGVKLGDFGAALVGRHNALNCLAAVAVADELRIPMETAAGAMASFGGIGRRFEFKGTAAGVAVYDDYGHHPSEIRATLAGARENFGGRIVVAFQPHRYTRTKLLMDEFAAAFGDADELLVADIYPASEKPIRGVTAEKLCRAISASGGRPARYVGARENAAGGLASIVREGDMVITLGAGDIWKTGMELLDLLRSGREVADAR